MSTPRNAAAYWFAQMTDLVLRMAVMLVIARVLGPELRGVLVSALLVNTMLVNLTNPGLQSAAMFFSGRAPADRPDLPALRRLRSIMLGIVLCVSAADWLLAAGVFVFSDPASEPRSIPPALIAAVLAAVPFSLHSMVAQGMLAGLGRVDRLARVLFRYSVGIHMLNAIALIPFFRRPEHLPAVLVCAWSAGEVAKALMLAREVRRATAHAAANDAAGPTEAGPGGERPVGARAVLSYGLRAHAGNAASVLVNRADHLFILAAGGTAGIGLYSLSARLAEPLFLLSAGVEAAGYRNVATAADARSAARATASLLRAMVLISVISIPALALAAEPLFRLALPGFAGSRVPFLILLPGVAFLACSRMLSLHFSAHLGRPQIPSLIAWLAASAGLAGLSVVVIHLHGGLTGAACVTTGSYALMFACHLILFIRADDAPGLAECLIPRAEDLAMIADRLRSLRNRAPARS